MFANSWPPVSNFKKKSSSLKVCSFLEHSCAILSSFKIVVIFNILSAEIKTKSADVLLKMTTILEELRIAQLQSINGETNGLYTRFFHTRTKQFSKQNTNSCENIVTKILANPDAHQGR